MLAHFLVEEQVDSTLTYFFCFTSRGCFRSERSTSFCVDIFMLKFNWLEVTQFSPILPEIVLSRGFLMAEIYPETESNKGWKSCLMIS